LDFLTRLEKSMEDLIEGTILSRFKTRIQPIEIAHALWREIRANKRVGVKETYVPNFFLVTLSIPDTHFLEPIQATMENEIIDHLERECQKRDFKTLGVMVIQWMADENGKEGEFLISSDFIRVKDLPENLKEKLRKKDKVFPVAFSPAEESATIAEEKGREKLHDTIELPAIKIRKKSEKNTPESLDKNQGESGRLTGEESLFSVIEGFDRGRIFRIAGKQAVIGRDNSCEISIGDPRVSRRHALVSRENGSYIIEDIGGKSGVFVNGEKVSRHILKNGDEILLGITRLEFKTP